LEACSPKVLRINPASTLFTENSIVIMGFAQAVVANLSVLFAGWFH
jgi:hypothetical protein